MMLGRSVLLMFFLLAGIISGQAATLNLGVLSFDTLIPAGTAPGVNVFTIENFTGDPAVGGFALPPDFPVLTGVGFLQAKLTVNTATSTTVFNLGDLLPGVYTPTTLQFSDTIGFTSALFTATLNPGTFLLSNGNTALPQTSRLTASLLPVNGSVLQPGIDFSPLRVAVADTPEPSTWLSFVAGLLLFGLSRKVFSLHRIR